MNIEIGGVGEEFRYSLEHIARLFFEEVNVSFTRDEQRDIQIQFKLATAKEIKVQGQLNAGNEMKQASFSLAISPDEPLKKQVKKVLNHVYFTLLEDFTGMVQPWGMLTGIRPTKLIHKMKREGRDNASIREELAVVYRVSEEKIALLENIAERQLSVVPDLYEIGKEVSIYIGIPFCPTKCAYCTFPAYAIEANRGSVDGFLAGLHYEIAETGKWLKENGIQITTIYYGGGTPTSITAEQMDALYEQVHRSFPNMERIRELTVEAGRPDTITEDKIAVLKKWNVDRISINPQSFENETLHAIGRHHSVEETIEKFQLARALGMNNINMDLIIGLPGEGIIEMEHTLVETAKLLPESLTVHTLSFKRASTMTKNKEKYKVASREEVAEMMELTTEWTKQYNYEPYYLYRQKNILGNLENVGYALEGKESIYNIMIMEEVQTIIGLGCGAASKLVDPQTGKITRYANPKDPHTYNERYKHYTHEKLAKLSEIFEIKNFQS